VKLLVFVLVKVLGMVVSGTIRVRKSGWRRIEIRIFVIEINNGGLTIRIELNLSLFMKQSGIGGVNMSSYSTPRRGVIDDDVLGRSSLRRNGDCLWYHRAI
jgi:hypothetical protein